MSVRLPNIDAFRRRLETALPPAIHYLNSPEKAGSLFERGDNELPDHVEARDLVLGAYSQVMADAAQRGTDFNIPDLTEEAVWSLIRGGHSEPAILEAAIDHVHRHGARQICSVYATAMRDPDFSSTRKANSGLRRHVNSMRDWGKGVLKLVGFTADKIGDAGRHGVMTDPMLQPWHNGSKELRHGLADAVNDIAISQAPPSPEVIELVNRRTQLMAEFRQAERDHVRAIAAIDELVANAGFNEFQRQAELGREASISIAPEAANRMLGDALKGMDALASGLRGHGATPQAAAVAAAMAVVTAPTATELAMNRNGHAAVEMMKGAVTNLWDRVTGAATRRDLVADFEERCGRVTALIKKNGLGFFACTDDGIVKKVSEDEYRMIMRVIKEDSELQVYSGMDFNALKQIHRNDTIREVNNLITNMGGFIDGYKVTLRDHGQPENTSRQEPQFEASTDRAMQKAESYANPGKEGQRDEPTLGLSRTYIPENWMEP